MLHINAQTTVEEDHQPARPILLLHFYCKRLKTEVGRPGLEPGTPRFSAILDVFLGIADGFKDSLCKPDSHRSCCSLFQVIYLGYCQIAVKVL
jgi:hypothetical protein